MRAGHFNSVAQAIGRVDFAIGFEPIRAPRWQTTLVLAGASTHAAAMTLAKRLTGVGYEDAVQSADKRGADELDDAGVCPLPELADAFDQRLACR